MNGRLTPMSFQILSSLDTIEADAPVSPLHSHFVALCRELVTALPPEGTRPLRAYALLERWRDNPLAAVFDAEYPELAGARSPVPDDFFKDRKDDAPCIVPLPDVLWRATPDGTLAEVLARDWFGDWFETSWHETRQRLTPQHFGAVIFSPESAREVAHHLANLGYQTPPKASQARMFRYQDPRVMQRVWPALTPWQRKLWMGPVRQWWSLVQPWGAWDAREQERGAQPDAMLPRWFKAVAPAPQTVEPDRHHPLRRLFDEKQWALAHTAPIGNRVWRRYADADVDVAAQPEGRVMNALLNEGRALGLDGRNLEDFAWCSSQSKYFAADLQSIPWSSPRWAPLLARMLSALQIEPHATFGGVFHEFVQPFEKVTA